MNIVHHDLAINVLKRIASNKIQLCFVDPPFGTDNVQSMKKVKSTRSEEGNVGFAGNTYSREIVSDVSYNDKFDDYMHDFLEPHLVETKRVLADNGTLCLLLDWRYVHYAKVFLDKLFGRDCFVNEIIWSFNFGGRGKRCFPRKHNTILVYSKTPNGHIFNHEDVDRIPYLAPSLQKSKERAERGQIPTDVWELGIIGTNARERLAYPSQKPVKLIKRCITAFSNKGDRVLDFCAGSGSTGEAAHDLGREFTLVDSSELAIETMRSRFANLNINAVYE